MVVVTHGRAPVPDLEAARYFDDLARYMAGTDRPRVLIWTDGSAPPPEHRKRLHQLLNRFQSVRYAIVTDSTFVRGVVHALRLFHPVFEAFPPRQMHEALRYLEVLSTRSAEVLGALEHLHAELPFEAARP
jgi:hypothetical protein